MSPATRRVRSNLGDSAVRSLIRSNPSERDIENTCSDFLVLDGWRVIKTDLPHLRGLGVPERGMSDRLYIRYHRRESITAIDTDTGSPAFAPFAEVMWIEWKKKGGKAKDHQRAWIATERARGALVWLAVKTSQRR